MIRPSRRVFIIGAGMSAECGAPLTRDFLGARFINDVKGRKLDLIIEFIQSAYANRRKPDIEKLWSCVDEAIMKGEKIATYDYRKLRELKNALMHILSAILTSVHCRMEETLAWFEVDWGPFFPDERALRTKVEDPVGWVESLIEEISLASSDHAEFFRTLITHDNAKDLRLALTAFFSRQVPQSADASTCISRLIDLLFPATKSKAGQTEVLFKQRLLQAVPTCDPKWIGRLHDDSYSKVCDTFFWGIYLIRNHKERLDELRGWLNTYRLLVHMLRSGDTVITTNYDLFLEMALMSWEGFLQREYGVLWGTDLTWMRADGQSYVPGTIADYARFERSSDEVGAAYRRMVKAQMPEREQPSKQKYEAYMYDEYERMYKEALRKWRLGTKEGYWVSILKLHGSLDWGICRNCNQVFAFRLTPFGKARPTILAHRQYDKAHKTHVLCCHNVQLEPLMVPPTWMKDYDNRPLVSIWSQAEKRLCDASSLVFLGYSLPLLDERIRKLFGKALYDRGGRSWDEVVVVNRSIDKVLPKYEKVFGKVTPVTCKTSDYLRDITNASG